jgi:hypothetical protein
MSRFIREQRPGFDDMPMQDDKPEPLGKAERCQQCAEAAQRMDEILQASEVDGHPLTSSDWAGMHKISDLLHRLAAEADNDTAESLRGVPALKDGRSLAEWVDDDRRTAPHRRELREWVRKA